MIAATDMPSAPDTRPSVHFSSQTNEWPTPQWLFDALHAEFAFTLDPCCTHENAKCPKHYTKTESGLLKSWQGETVFMNPPYGREIAAWMKKAHEAANDDGATVVCLVPSRTDTKWWHSYAMPHEIRLLRGRLTFNGWKDAPFASAIVVMRPRSFRIVAQKNERLTAYDHHPKPLSCRDEPEKEPEGGHPPVIGRAHGSPNEVGVAETDQSAMLSDQRQPKDSTGANPK